MDNGRDDEELPLLRVGRGGKDHRLEEMSVLLASRVCIR